MRRPHVLQGIHDLQGKHVLQASASKRAPALGLTAIAALITGLLAACSSNGGETGTLSLPSIGSQPSGVVPYKHGNAISPLGYSESLLGENRYQVKVTGRPHASLSQMEKIAHARAAEIGKELKLRQFKVENIQHTTSCTKARSTPKGGGHPDLHYRVLTADVTYTKSREAEPGFRESRSAFKQLRAELDQPIAPSPADSVPFQCPS